MRKLIGADLLIIDDFALQPSSISTRAGTATTRSRR